MSPNILASIDTRANGFFVQNRVGRNGRLFSFIKLRTMRHDPSFQTTITTDTDPRITRLGRFFRKTKLYELPQLINVLLEQVSFVSLRPDVPGFADQLEGEDRVILTMRPGITGPATLKYRNEEEILAQQLDPERYNDVVIFPDKIKINEEYIDKYSFMGDIRYILLRQLNTSILSFRRKPESRRIRVGNGLNGHPLPTERLVPAR